MREISENNKKESIENIFNEISNQWLDIFSKT